MVTHFSEMLTRNDRLAWRASHPASGLRVSPQDRDWLRPRPKEASSSRGTPAVGGASMFLAALCTGCGSRVSFESDSTGRFSHPRVRASGPARPRLPATHEPASSRPLGFSSPAPIASLRRLLISGVSFNIERAMAICCRTMDTLPAASGIERRLRSYRGSFVPFAFLRGIATNVHDRIRTGSQEGESTAQQAHPHRSRRARSPPCKASKLSPRAPLAPCYKPRWASARASRQRRAAGGNSTPAAGYSAATAGPHSSWPIMRSREPGSGSSTYTQPPSSRTGNVAMQ